MRPSKHIIYFLAWTLLSGCVTTFNTPHLDPPLFLVPTNLDAWREAEEFAYIEGGDVYTVADTHSMEPTLWGGDYIVVRPGDFNSWKVGQILMYQPTWQPAPATMVVHRIVDKDSGGLIMSGDNVPYSESGYRVTDKNDGGLVIGIWRVKKP